MIRLVVDASVALKWFLPLVPQENHVTEAVDILGALDQGLVELYQPSHFIAEVAAVLARLRPQEAKDNLFDLLNTAFHRVESTAVYMTACDLAIRLNHHLFDTLYHAVALHTHGATLITADQRYFNKAHSMGQIVQLGDQNLFD